MDALVPVHFNRARKRDGGVYFLLTPSCLRDIRRFENVEVEMKGEKKKNQLMLLKTST